MVFVYGVEIICDIKAIPFHFMENRVNLEGVGFLPVRRKMGE